MRKIALGLTLGALLGLLLTWHGETLAQTFGLGNFKRITTQRVTQTVADNGGGTAPSFTVTTAEVGYVEVDCQDSNGCTGTLSESGAREGQDLMVCQVSASPGLVTFSDSSGVTELLNGTAYVMAQWECLSLRYVGDRWMETSRTQFAGALTASDVATFTSKTYDAEGTSNVLTVPFKLWVPAAVCNNATPSSPLWSFPTSNPAAPACQTGTNTQYGTLDFADGVSPLSAQLHLMLSSDFTGTLGLALKWFTSATSGSVVWQASTICVANAETSDPAFNTASTVTDGALGTTLQTNDAAIASVTITGCAAGELLFLRVLRDPTHASDTLAATARLVGVELTVRRAM
jgi:hypothetical protein